jgi:hypothetical protein
MRGLRQTLWLFLLAAATGAQVPFARMSPFDANISRTVVQRPDFTFQTQTPPVKVRLETMDRLFDHPRLAAAMWRHCQFAPTLWAFEHADGSMTIDDGRGLKGTLVATWRQPGMRVFYIEGRVDTWRMGNPFPVGARMVVIYRYWMGSKGYESHLQTWTTLDSAVLRLVTRSFRKYIEHRQQEFIGYIMNNMAQGGAFAEVDPQEFRVPILLEGDPLALREFDEVFRRPSRSR